MLIAAHNQYLKSFVLKWPKDFFYSQYVIVTICLAPMRTPITNNKQNEINTLVAILSLYFFVFVLLHFYRQDIIYQ